mmetsp:Transcript_117921/g.234912  ORF Transcript_117921/g.234912 Transcript_117921/m.234912 type:complete len:266 (-) Transcript_117921:1594-2391(-)
MSALCYPRWIENAVQTGKERHSTSLGIACILGAREQAPPFASQPYCRLAAVANIQLYLLPQNRQLQGQPQTGPGQQLENGRRAHRFHEGHGSPSTPRTSQHPPSCCMEGPEPYQSGWSRLGALSAACHDSFREWTVQQLATCNSLLLAALNDKRNPACTAKSRTCCTHPFSCRPESPACKSQLCWRLHQCTSHTRDVRSPWLSLWGVLHQSTDLQALLHPCGQMSRPRELVMVAPSMLKELTACAIHRSQTHSVWSHHLPQQVCE